MSKKGLLAAIGALLIGYIIGLPYLTAYEMKVAAKNRDGEALSEYIDFPSVRQNLREQMNARLTKELSGEKLKENPFAVLGAAFAGVMIDKALDAYVTPAGITQLMAGNKLDEKSDKVADDNFSNDPFQNSSMAYESTRKFVINVKDDAGESVKFVLRRNGMDWKLTEIILPSNI